MQETALAIARHFCLLCAVLTPLELLLPACRAQGLWRRGSLTDLSYFVVSPFLINAGIALVLSGMAAAARAIVPAAARAHLSAQPLALQFIAIFLIAETSAYFVHRASHRVGWLWRFHRIHHSVQQLDWLAAHRQHPLEAIWLLGIANLPIVLLGFPIEPFAWFVLAQKIYTAFLHANVGIGYGRLSQVLASPQFHHWHHDARGGAQTVNYASTLPILDWLFGTYEVPAAGFPSRYGLASDDISIDEGDAGQDRDEGYIRQLLAPLRPQRTASRQA